MTRRTSKRTGKSYAVGSQHGWDGLPAHLRVCIVCGERVTLDQSSQQHTEAGVTTLRHTACRAAA